MPRYIDADLMLCGRSDDVLYDSGGYRVFIREWLESQPTIDAVPVVRGEWKLLDECSNAGVYCSVCHKAVFRERAWYKNVHIQSKFCPNCGAKMEDKP